MHNDLDYHLRRIQAPSSFSPETYSLLKADGFIEDGRLRSDLINQLNSPKSARTLNVHYAAGMLRQFLGALLKKLRRI